MLNKMNHVSQQRDNIHGTDGVFVLVLRGIKLKTKTANFRKT